MILCGILVILMMIVFRFEIERICSVRIDDIS